MPKQILEGSRAIALAVKNIAPAVVAAYPITPQTHIVEALAKFKADGEADFEFLRAESEFAAASMIVGAAAAGVRTYSATSSQGLLLMNEVIYNIAGMRLPVVITCANRAVSAPINIWNDQQDMHTVSPAGWVHFFAENNQEAVDQHILAFKIAEEAKLPVMVNVDGFVLTHTYEPVAIPTAKEIKKFLPAYKPAKGEYLDPASPATLGAFATPAHYMEIREELHNDLTASFDLINKEYEKIKKMLRRDILAAYDNGLVEYAGPKNPKTIIVAMGSILGTIKDAVDEMNKKSSLPPFIKEGIGVLKIKTYRPFPAEAILNIIKKAKYVAVIDKAITLGHMGPLAADIKAAAQGKMSGKIQSFIAGLGGRDITKEMIKKIVKEVEGRDEGVRFVGK